MARARAERGSATTLAAGIIVALAALATLLFQLVAAAGERMEAQNVADLSAIAAAITYRDTSSQEGACARARELVLGYSITGEVEGRNVRVTVRRESRFAWITRAHEASAVAGPARGP